MNDILKDLDLENSPLAELQKIISEQIKKIVQGENEYIIHFLTSKGYRPKSTKEYIKGLKYRLKKKGLELRIFRENIYSPYNEKTEMVGMTVNMLCAIEPITSDPQITAKLYHETICGKGAL